jgi:hypothetical protein
VSATLVAAAGPGGNGDHLHLFFSEDVVLAPDAGLTDDDLEVSTGTLGEPSEPLRLANPRTLVLPLDPGVRLIPGTTTVQFRPGNDAVTDNSGNPVVPYQPRLVSAGDGDAPLVTRLTLCGVDDLLNGNGPAGGTLQVPRHGFTIDLGHVDPSSPVDPSRTAIVATVAVDVNGVGLQAGLDLAPHLHLSTTGTTSSFLVPPTLSFPEGVFGLQAYVFDSSGMVSIPAEFVALAKEGDDDVRPFETSVHPSQLWFIDTSRDVEAYSVNVFDFVRPVRVASGPNGRTDLDDLFLAIGLACEAPVPDLSGGPDSNQAAKENFEAAVLAELAALFQGCNVEFTFQRPGPFPASTSVPYAAVGFSQIALSGAEHGSGTTGTLGVALFDPNNRHQEDNAATAYRGHQRLGVFLHTLVNDGIIAHPTTRFRATFDPFIPARYGTPIGEAAGDLERLAGRLTDQRTTRIVTALAELARFAAVILAHECGHSVGLVANGPMPVGLYGNDAVHFPVYPSSAADGHIKMPASLFPGRSENVMSPAFDFESALAPETRFNTLNHAYLRERVLTNGR